MCGLAGDVAGEDQRSPRASDDGPGTEQHPLRTIGAAAASAEPGDTVLIHEGVYRERVCPARGGEEGKPITYRAADRQRVIIKGSEVFDGPWSAVPGHPHVLRAELGDHLFDDGYSPLAIALRNMPAGMTLGQVFLDGQRLREVTSVAERTSSFALPNRSASTAVAKGLMRPTESASRSPR